MTTYTWTPGINGNWLTAADWTTGTIPGATDTATFQPATGTGSYTVLVSQFDFVNVNAVNLAAAAGAPNAGLVIDGSLNVGTLQYTGSGAASPIDVRAGGLLDIASAITEDAPSLETISVSGNGATLTLGTTSVYNPAVAFSFNNNASGPNSGAVVYNSGYFSGTTLAQTINNFAEGDKLTFANANFTGDTALYDAGSTTLTVKDTSGATVLRMVDVSAPANETFSSNSKWSSDWLSLMVRLGLRRRAVVSSLSGFA